MHLQRPVVAEYSQEISPSEASRSSTQKPISTGAVNDLQDAINGICYIIILKK